MCKYNVSTKSCETSVDVINDKCEVKGINMYGCLSLKGKCIIYLNLNVNIL